MQRQEQEESERPRGAEQARHRGPQQGGQQAQRLRRLGQEEERWFFFICIFYHIQPYTK